MDDRKIILSFLFATFLLSDNNMLLAMTQPSSIVNSSQIQTYIVHVQHPEGVTLLSTKERENFYRSFLPNSTLDTGEPRLVYSYDVVMSGFAARMTPEELRVIGSMDGFVHAEPETSYSLQTTYTPLLLGLNQWKSLWKDSKCGEGMIIGVIDSGITPSHPSFNDDGTLPSPPTKWRGKCGFRANICNKKLIGAVAFLKGASPEPYDKGGHGTHVAGIAAGSKVDDASVLGQGRGTAAGMAPKAHLAVYKVCEGGCKESDVLKAIQQAIKDGVDVINLSLGGGKAYKTLVEGTAQGTFAAMVNGVIPVAAVGNEGVTKSLMSNAAPWMLTVGAASTDRRATAVVRLGNGMEFVGQSAYQPNPSNSTMLPIVYPGVKQTQDTLSCQNGSMTGFDVKGKIVICGTGCAGKKDCDRVNKGKVVKEAGGVAMIVVSQPWDGFTTNADPHIIPTAHINFVDSVKLIFEYLETEKNPTATIEFRGTTFGVRPSPTVAGFSSRGPSLINGGILKPDLIAPGVDILSAWNSEVGPNPTGSTKNFFFGSGTSQATPHVTGIAALLKKTHPQWSAAAIKSALMTTAHRNDRDGKPISDDKSETLAPSDAFALGAGHVDPLAANDPGLVYDIQPDDYISYLCGIKSPKLSDQNVSVIVNKPISCSRRHKINTEQLNYPSILVSLGNGTSKIRVNRTVTNVGEASSVYDMKVKNPKGVAVKVTPSTLQFSSLDQKESFTVDLSLTGSPPVGDDAWEGEILWVSSDNKYAVRSPVVVTA